MNRKGFSLVEILIAAVVMAGLGACLMGVIQGNSQVSARAGEMQMASMVGARAMDGLLAQEYAGLEARLTARPAETEQFAIDGFTFTATSRLSRPKPGLLAIQLAVTWQRFGTPGPKDPGQLHLVRLICDPLAAMSGAEVR